MTIWTHLAQHSFEETPRLFLRPPLITDLSAFHELASDPQNVTYIFPAQASREESLHLWTHAFLKHPLGTWVLEDPHEHRLIGVIRLEKIQESLRQAEVGYFLHKKYWGQSLMAEALSHLCQILLESGGLESLSLQVHLENTASQRVAQKAGFELLRQFKGSDRYSRKMRDYLEFRRKRGRYE
ncbi:GNAT family N-acetyltransferase [Streptococcus sp. NLN64]|uniref:GNAT family N-acetyltransferase n=1 Tax=Streptococcus sp. NLN64 TaxID=2822799 RepID=UPI0018CB5552|nr:GNAT family N-acetyltransferase [Streptococcus sp. NLN64]